MNCLKRSVFVLAAAIAAAGITSSCKKGGDETEAVKYAITMEKSNGGVSAIAKVAGATATEAAAGQRVNISAVAMENFHFEKWECIEGDVTFIDENAASTNFIMPAKTVKIKAHFEDGLGRPSTLHLSNLVKNGTIQVTVDGEVVATSSYVETTMRSVQIEEGKRVDIEVIDIGPTPPGYVFKYFTLRDALTGNYDLDEWLDEQYDNPTHFTMQYVEGGITVNAIVQEKGYKVSTSVNDATMGKVRIISYTENDGGSPHNNTTEGETTLPIYTGRKVTITALPEPGYRFKEWTEVTGYTLPEANKSDIELTFQMPSNDVSGKAVFEVIPDVYSKVTFSQVENNVITVTIPGATAELPAVPVVSGVTDIKSGTVVTVKSEPAEHYIFGEWSGAEFTDKDATETTFIMGDENVTISASVAKAKYQLTFSATVGCSVTGKVDNVAITSPAQVEWGKTVELTAVKGEGEWAFTGFTTATEGVGINTIELVGTFTMPKSATLVAAEFEDNNPVEHAYVEIGGLKWCTVNVDTPGKFAASETDPGKFYQWGFGTGFGVNTSTGAPVPYPSTNVWHNLEADWGIPTYDENAGSGQEPKTWPVSQNPCPKGWRLPTEPSTAEGGTTTNQEFSALLAATTAAFNSDNSAIIVTDKTEPTKQLTFPLPGGVIQQGATSYGWNANNPTCGNGGYWSGTKRSAWSGTTSSQKTQRFTARWFKTDLAQTGASNWNVSYNISTANIRFGLMVRCVKAE